MLLLHAPIAADRVHPLPSVRALTSDLSSADQLHWASSVDIPNSVGVSAVLLAHRPHSGIAPSPLPAIKYALFSR